MRTRPTGECVRCHRPRAIHGRGLCTTCWDNVADSGRLHEYRASRVDRMAQVRPMLDDGMTTREIADALGITHNAAMCARRALRRNLPAAATTHWRTDGHPAPQPQTLADKLHVPPMPAPRACEGEHPTVFDIPETRRPILIADKPAPWIEGRISAALRVCARCPLAAREWCVTSVDPERHETSIIAGGVVWQNGRAVWTLADEERVGLDAADVAEAS